jgi:N-acetylglucosaminyldiphosphoundecaprenol N-acetyl-beta-D-mannosaminyltransferase
MQEKVKILKVKFDSITLSEATKKALDLANDKKQHYFTTPNPEILLEATNNNKFKKVLNKSSLNTPDGVGIIWAANYLHSVRNTNSFFIKLAKWAYSLVTIPFTKKSILKERVTGADLVLEICKASSKKDNKIFLLGAAEGIAKETANILEAKFPGVKIVGKHSGTPNPADEKEIIKLINKARPNILFVAYGAPKQELWISRNLKSINSVKLAGGIGGTFDFIAGKLKRAPEWMQKLGLEWLYRLFQQPSRIKRIFNASVVFPIKVLLTS